jgi:hypothetical protein
MAGKCRPDAIAFKEFPYFGDRTLDRRRETDFRNSGIQEFRSSGVQE